jgi:hypothetical protein
MADIVKLRVMISSRSLKQVFGGLSLSDVRMRLQARLEAVRWQAPAFAASRAAAPVVVGRDQPLLDVWIHENDPGEDSAKSTFEVSLREINRADLVIVLYTGDAGSAAHDSEMGICHAELYEAVSRRPQIVSLMALTPLKKSTVQRDVAFHKFVEDQKLYSKEADSEETLHTRIMELLQERIAVLAKRSGSGASRQRDRGQALDWRQLDLQVRRQTMRDALRAALIAYDTGAIAKRKASDKPAPVSTKSSTSELQAMLLPSGVRVLARLDAIPAALTVAAARELVGQPFLRDHLHSAALEKANLPGVVHLIACHRGATEAQALRMLGTPDAVAVPSYFGVLVADHVQNMQLILLTQCSDVTAIALALRRLSEWLAQSGEETRVIARAKSRRRILLALAAEQARPPDTAAPARSNGKSTK